jgi:hypothetical protein
MSLISSNRRSYSNSIGNKAEQVFFDIVKSKGVDIIKSSREDDIFKHIDFYINGVGIDIKSRRHLNCIWLERTNVHGKNGWLRGEAKYIGLEIVELKSFCFFKRIDLLEYVSRFNETTSSKDCYFKWYTRRDWNRKDEIIKVRYKDIHHLETKRLSYATN